MSSYGFYLTLGVIFALIVPFNQTNSEEPSLKLTPFNISFAKEDFTKFARVHGILLLDEGKSATLHVKLQNTDDKIHEIRFHIQMDEHVYGTKEAISVKIEPQSITVKPHSSEQATLSVTAKSNLTETGVATIGVAAYSTTFGATGDSFFVVFGKNVTDYDTSGFDTAMRVALPGSVTSYVNRDVEMKDIENLFGHSIAFPSYLPYNYSLRHIDYSEDHVRLLYSPVEITPETGWYEFWRDGGMYIIYYKHTVYYDEAAGFGFHDLLLSWTPSGAQEVMVNDFKGIARDRRDQVTNDFHFTEPADALLYKGNFSIDLRGNMPLDELLKVGASIQWQEQPSLHDLKLVNNTLLIPFDKDTEPCCHSVAISPDGRTIAYSASTYNNETHKHIGQLWLYDISKNTTKYIDTGNKFSFIHDLNFSPKGNELLFVSDECNGICILSMPEQRLSTIQISDVESADWMPDGSIVVLRHGEASFMISLYKRDGTELLLYRQEASVSDIFYVKPSPDGKQIAFVSDKPLSILEIYVLDAESSQVKKVVDNKFRPIRLTWSPDGKYLVYVQSLFPRPPDLNFESSNPLSLINILNINKNQTTTLVRPSNSMAIYALAISPDSNRIVYALDAPSSFPTVSPTAQPGIYAAELGTTIPEFPVNLMAITSIGIMAVVIMLRLKTNRVLR